MDAKALDAKNNHEMELLQKHSVQGTGVGVKWVDGKPTTEPAVIVFVESKLPEDGVCRKFSADEVIPSQLDGVPTDIIEVGKIVKQNGFRDRVRPAKPGFSCGHGTITAGTIGGFFLDASGEPVFLSNNHVLATENGAAVGDPIFQPGKSDNTNANFSGWNEPIINCPCIGTLKKYMMLERNGNQHDSAIASVHPSLFNQNLVDLNYPVVNRPLAGWADPAVNMAVQKCGRTTGYTTGKILALEATFTIGYDFGDATFTRCIVTTAMSDGGDSGSLITNMDMKAVGLLFAGSSKVTLANLFSTVRDYYGLKLWGAAPTTPNTPPSDGDERGSASLEGWQKFTKDGEIVVVSGEYAITENANQYCFLEKSITDFKAVSCVINTGTDAGATWGPGLVVQWPEGFLKVNLRHGGTFGGVLNGNENLSVGRVKPQTDYTLRIRKTARSYVGEVMENRRWYSVIEVPRSVFPSKPAVLRVGKTGTNGSTIDHNANESGPMGACVVRNIKIV